ncbi:hypothetical protein MCW_00346 [Cardidatus Bartonella washoeensis 085-0475]|uniref:Uncharacterized protein n=1 Tax=Cardidatus Bartonella washoeensis 085-0475 TaxID=1094564 RepID=J1JQ12_9HYPH|nr:hypothetical protein MCW_00346 [Bartonella washoeensis 085-0475]
MCLIALTRKEIASSVEREKREQLFIFSDGINYTLLPSFVIITWFMILEFMRWLVALIKLF